MNTVKINATVTDKGLVGSAKADKKKLEEPGYFRLSMLSRARSDRNFEKNFRRRSNVLIRLLKEQAKAERNMVNHIETLEKIEEIKTKNDFYTMKYRVKKEYLSTGKLIEKQPDLGFEEHKKMVRTASKKGPAPISSFRFDPHVIPDCTKKPVTFEELELYLQSKRNNISRYFNL